MSEVIREWSIDGKTWYRETIALPNGVLLGTPYSSPAPPGAMKRERMQEKKVTVKTMTVYDCQDMPEDVKEAFWSYNRRAEYDSVGNDCYVDWWVHAEVDPPPERELVDQWLIKHGAKPHEQQTDEDDGHVLIHHWW